MVNIYRHLIYINIYTNNSTIYTYRLSNNWRDRCTQQICGLCWRSELRSYSQLEWSPYFRSSLWAAAKRNERRRRAASKPSRWHGKQGSRSVAWRNRRPSRVTVSVGYRWRPLVRWCPDDRCQLPATNIIDTNSCGENIK